MVITKLVKISNFWINPDRVVYCQELPVRNDLGPITEIRFSDGNSIRVRLKADIVVQALSLGT